MRTIRSLFFYLGVAVILVFFVSPLLWLVSTSFKNNRDAFAIPPKILFNPTFDNYVNVFGRSAFFKAVYNSLFISVTSTVLCLIIGSIAAYALAFFYISKRTNILTFILSTRIAPPLLMLLPVYFLAVKIGVNDSYFLLILIYLLMNLPFAILMLLVWNEFFIALVLTGKQTQTLPVLITSFMTFEGTEWGPLTAAGSVIMLPMLIFGVLVQKHLVKGMTMGALK